MNYIALSFDIEDWYYTPLISGASISRYGSIDDFLANQQEQVIDCITEETVRLIEILDHFKIKATFFLVADVSQRYRKITEILKKSSHEIASHSLTHQSAIDSKTKKPFKSVQEWTEDQHKAKDILVETFEREIIGFRAPGAYFADWMVKPLQQLGFKYDSSIAYNSFYNKTNVKLGNIPTTPYKLNSVTLGPDNADTELIELPWSYNKMGKRLILPAGGAYFFRLFGYKYFKNVLSRALKEGDTMFYLHPLDISVQKIPEANIKHRPAFWINKGKRTEERLIKLLKTFPESFRTCGDIYRRSLNES